VTIEPVRITTHLHGGHVSAAADGNPYRVPLDEETLPGQTQSVRYANDQGAALAWYHDHALGITRSNVMSGLAGGYLITDPDDAATGLPPLARDIPLILQDRLIDPQTGQLVYPGPGLPPGREWIPEFFGDVMLVNGGIWPELVVRPRTYRLRLLNGSNARFYNLRFVASTDGLMSVTQIGTDLGYLPEPARTKEILAAPAERCDLIVDFSGLAGQTVELRDTILPPGTVSPASPLPRRGIMRFTVSGATASDPVPSLPVPPSSPEADRRIVRTLEEVMDPAASFPLMALLDGKMFHDPLSAADRIRNGTTVEWDLVNLTADTHPIHLHLVDFEVVHRQKLDVRRYLEALAASRTDPEDPSSVWDPVLREGYDGWMSEPLPDPDPFLRSRVVRAPATERGPKDTVRANPGEVTRIRATFRVPDDAPLPARYVWHCHILEHEDNDMMRPYRVVSSEG
jgi:FtsP/CotA-like multicopper oxidase with cupredoxin domain